MSLLQMFYQWKPTRICGVSVIFSSLLSYQYGRVVLLRTWCTLVHCRNILNPAWVTCICFLPESRRDPAIQQHNRSMYTPLIQFCCRTTTFKFAYMIPRDYPGEISPSRGNRYTHGFQAEFIQQSVFFCVCSMLSNVMLNSVYRW